METPTKTYRSVGIEYLHYSHLERRIRAILREYVKHGRNPVDADQYLLRISDALGEETGRGHEILPGQ